MALRALGKTYSVVFWEGLGWSPSDPVILSSTCTLCVLLFGYCFITKSSKLSMCANHRDLGLYNVVWVVISTWGLVWPCTCDILPDLQTPVKSHSSLDGKYSSCCCQRTLIFHNKPGGISVGQTKHPKSRFFSVKNVYSGWYL